MHGIFRSVYETVQFAKLKLLARALDRAQLYEGGRLVVSYLVRTDFADVGAEEPYSEGIIDYLRPAEGAEMVALIREPPGDGGPTRRISLRSSQDEVDVSAVARKAGGGGHRQAAGFSSAPDGRGDRGVLQPPAPSSLPMPPRANRPAGSCSSTSRRARRRSRSSADLRAAPARNGHTGTLDPFATGLLRAPLGAATRLAPCFVGLDKRYVTEVDLTATTTTGDPEGDVVERARAAGAADLERGSTRFGARSSCRSPPPPP